MSTNKKAQQLGINPSTASGRLVKDLLFNFVINQGIQCYHCNEPLTRDTFSIEHKVPWLDSDNPKFNFFNLKNISYSHLKCNILAGRKPNRKYKNKDEKLKAHAKREKDRWNLLSKDEQQLIRREKYLKYSK